MNAPLKTAVALPEADPIYAIRDDLARVYYPANAVERMLVGSAAQAWLRFQQASEFESRVFENAAPADLFAANADAFKTLARYVAISERNWRLALHQLQSAQRARLKNAAPFVRRYDHAA